MFANARLKLVIRQYGSLRETTHKKAADYFEHVLQHKWSRGARLALNPNTEGAGTAFAPLAMRTFHDNQAREPIASRCHQTV